MKTHILVSVDVDVAEACKDRRHGFTSKTCNDALRIALELPESKEEVQRKNQVNKVEFTPKGIYVKGIGFVREKEMIGK